jgi:proline racemase
MDEEQGANDQKFRIVAAVLLLLGIFVLAVGGGMFYLANAGKGDIKIISVNAPDDIKLSDIKSGKVNGVAVRVVNINKATRDDLIGLPGIGEVIADKIIAGRPYVVVDDLLNDKTVNKSVYTKIKDFVIVEDDK